MDFIMSNLFLIILIVGGLISFFARMNQNSQSESQSQPQEAEQRQEREIRWEDFFPSASEPKEESSSKPNSPAGPSPSGPLGRPAEENESDSVASQRDMYERLEHVRSRNKELTETVVGAIGEEVQLERNPSSSTNRLDLRLNQLSNSEVMKGVVWAEVLGPPKSRQHPHARPRHRNV
ncbi:hypothetical protein [Shouchella shacheensis]|uniref:hypothetical protein n=1 Tax=Shouchella shacheensis TaxID=1649580 RepID=UPI000740479A|nr:hypothetical protein [Shouchella shacheensis]